MRQSLHLPLRASQSWNRIAGTKAYRTYSRKLVTESKIACSDGKWFIHSSNNPAYINNWAQLPKPPKRPYILRMFQMTLGDVTMQATQRAFL
jgi:hypothetical protein